MSDTKTTPGEWRNAGKGCHVLIAVAAGDLDICYLVRNPEQEANANLIAASKELYAALEVVVRDWTEQFERNGHMKPEWCKQARAALAKARGEAEEPVTYPEPIRVPGNEVTIDIARQEEMNDYSARGGNE